jgi:hypothetical protein
MRRIFIITATAWIASVQLCFAMSAERQKAAEAGWSTFGETIKAELRRLAAPGRAAFRDALVACTLAADEYLDEAPLRECQRAVKYLQVEFFPWGKAMTPPTFDVSIDGIKIAAANVRLSGRHDPTSDAGRYPFLDVLKRAYDEVRAEAPSASPSSRAAQGTLTDAQIAARIVTQSRANYHASGRPCACPDDLASNGSRCGQRSAYSRPGGAEPYCYPSDVPRSAIEAYRQR